MDGVSYRVVRKGFLEEVAFILRLEEWETSHSLLGEGAPGGWEGRAKAER